MTRAAPRSRARRVGIAATSIGAVVVLAGITVAVHEVTRPADVPRTEGPGLEPLPVEVGRADPATSYVIRRAFVGRVEAGERSELGFELGGMLVSVEVDEGDRVAAGDELARLDTARLDARRHELVAALDRARADAELAALTQQRLADAAARAAATEQELDEATLGLAAARARTASAQAAIDRLDVDVAKTVLRSPFDAVVARRATDPGRVLTAGTPVLTLLAAAAPEARIALSGDAADTVQVGDRRRLEIAGRTVDARVTAVLPVRDRNARGVDVRFQLDAALGDVRDGDLARLLVERPVDADGFWVPVSALAEGTRGLWTLLVLAPDERRPDTAVLQRVDVEVLHAETGRVFVRGPVDADTPFVRRGLHRVVPGMTVRPATEASLAARR